MSAQNRMDAASFNQWCAQQGPNWELVQGQPVRLSERPRRRRDRILANIRNALTQRLQDAAAVFSGSAVVATESGANLRRPDLLVDGGAKQARGAVTETPSAIFEVMANGADMLARMARLEEYKRLPTLRHIVLIDQHQAQVLALFRVGDAWRERVLIGLGATLPLLALGVDLPLAEIFKNVVTETQATAGL